MDWELVIKKNREALIGIVAALFALAGLTPANPAARLMVAKSVHRSLLKVLRPAEAATRRLIIMAARNGKIPFLRQTAARPDFGRFRKAEGSNQPSFRLIDPRKQFFANPGRTFAKTAPRISLPGITPVAFPTSAAGNRDKKIDATRLAKRLAALKAALDDLPRQARRLARYRARMQQQMSEQNSSRIKLPPLRPGMPPGHRKRKKHAVDDILFECHLLACKH